MDYTQFYVLSNTFEGQPYRLDCDVIMSKEKQIAISQGRESVNEPMQLRKVGGRHPRDFLAAPTWLNFVSQKFIGVMQQNKFSGWGKYPIVVENDRGTSITQQYSGFFVSGKSGPLTDKLSYPASALPLVPQGKPSPTLYGLFFEPDSWDGSDVFSPQGTGGVIMVVKRVKDALFAANLTNVCIERLDLYRLMGRSGGRKSVGDPL